MGLDFVINLAANGADQFAADAKKIANDLDKSEASSRRMASSLDRWRDRLAKLAQEERKAAFSKLSTEQQLLKVSEHRVRVEEMLARADVQANARRHTALKLRQQELKAQQSQLSGTRSPSGGFLAGMQGRMGVLGSAGIGGALGGAIGSMITAIPSAIGSAFRFVMSKLQLGDQISDEAELYGISPLERLKVRRAAPMAGISEQVGLRSLAQLKNARAAALTDPDLAKIFANYGVDSKMVADEDANSTMAIGRQVFQSMGSAGSQLSDRPHMRKLFGNRPAQAEAMFKQLAEMSDADFSGMEDALKTLDAANRQAEIIKAKVEDATTKATARVVHSQMVSPRKHFWEQSVKPEQKGFWNQRVTLPFLPSPVTTPSQPQVVPPAPSLTTPRTAGILNIPKKQDEAATIQAPRSLPTADALQRIGLFRGANGEREITRRLDAHARQFQAVINQLERLNTGVRSEE